VLQCATQRRFAGRASHCHRLPVHDSSSLGRFLRPSGRLLTAMASVLVAMMSGTAWALQPLPVGDDDSRIEVNSSGEFYADSGDALTIELAPNSEGVVGRMWVRSRTDGSRPAWFVFALKNVTKASIERWLAPQQPTSGTGARLVAVTPSIGSLPERIGRDGADAFRLVIPPWQTVTFVVELSSSRYLPMYLWPRSANEQTPSQR